MKQAAYGAWLTAEAEPARHEERFACANDE